MRSARRFALVVVAGLLAVGAGGCSWLIGVSEDPVVVEPQSDASDRAEDAVPDPFADAGVE